MKKFRFLSILVLMLTLVLVAPKVTMAGNLSFEKDEVLASSSLVAGVQYQQYTANSVNDEGTPGKQQVSMVSIAPGSAQVISWAIPSGNGIRPSTVRAIAEDYEAKHPNMMVIAAINNDYFGNTAGVFSMRNPSVCEGVVYRNSGISNMHGLGIAENNVYKLSKKGEKLEVSENYVLDIYDANGLIKIKSIELSGFNTLPGDGQTSLCYNSSAISSFAAGEVFEINATSASRIDSTYYIEGQISGSVQTINSTNPSILTTDEEIANLLASNAKVKIYKTLAGEWAEYDFVLGCPAQTLKDGEVLSVAEIGDYGQDHVALRHPRTTIGFKEDGTMVLMVIDGRQADKGMDGVSERENALALKNEGCVSAFNFDGGGSSTLLIRKNGQFVVCNSPSDGAERSDANALLVVVPKTEITLDYDVTVQDDGTATIKGSADIETLNGFEYNKAILYVNGLATELNAEDFELTGLAAGREYVLSVMLLYPYGASTKGGSFYSETVKVDGNARNYPNPSVSNVECQATANGFKLKVEVDDPLQEITKMTATYNGRTVNFTKAFGYFTANVFGGTPESLSIDIEYQYRDGLNNTQKGTHPFTYLFGPEPEPVPGLVGPEGFEVELTENKDAKYTVEYTYEANDATEVKVYAVIDGEEVLLDDEVLLETSEIEKLVVKYVLGTEEKELEVTEFELEVLPYEDDNNGQGGSNGGGMSCSFGTVWTASIISLLALAVLVIKRK